MSALIAGVAAPNAPVLQPVARTPSPTVAPSQTPPLTAAPAIPTAPSTPAQGQSGTVLYQADWSQGLNGWSGGPNWKALNGMAVSDGTVNQGTPYTLTAPFLPGTEANYAEEADIQFIRFPQYPSSCPTFGMEARVSPTTWYAMTITPDSEQCYQSTNTYGRNTISIASVTCDQSGNNCQPPVLISTAFTVDTNWHTYRFELNGNNLRVLIDRHVVLVTQDNLILTPGKVGLSSYYTQVNVRSFKVIALK